MPSWCHTTDFNASKGALYVSNYSFTGSCFVITYIYITTLDEYGILNSINWVLILRSTVISFKQPNSASDSAKHCLADRPSRRNLWISCRLTSHLHSHRVLDLCGRVVCERAASEILIARPLTVNKDSAVFSFHTKPGLNNGKHKKRGEAALELLPSGPRRLLGDAVRET